MVGNIQKVSDLNKNFTSVTIHFCTTTLRWTQPVSHWNPSIK